MNGIKIYYAIWGDGSPLILLHGGLGNTDYFGGQVPEFAKQYRVIAMDSRGHEAIRQEHDVEIAKAIPGAKLVILPGLSHFAMLQDPKAFNQAVLEFLK